MTAVAPQDIRSIRDDTVLILFDNPGGAWLHEAQEWAVEKAKLGGVLRRMIDGPTTGWARGITLPTSLLARVPGASGERRVAGERQYDGLLARVQREGWQPDPILVCVNHLGEPYIVEGNTRVAIARDLAIACMPAEVRWKNGAELAGGLLSPMVVQQHGSVLEQEVEQDDEQRPGFRF